MDVRSIGVVKPVRELAPSQCVIFAVNGSAAIGIVVQKGAGELGIIHIEAMRDGNIVPAVYGMHHFSNEIVIHIESARVVPVLSPEHVGFGRPNITRISPILYINESEVILNAVSGEYVMNFDILSGKSVHLNDYSSIYTKAWYIEVVTQDGSFEPFHEVRVEL